MGPSRELGNRSIAPRLGLRKKKHGTKSILRDSFMTDIFERGSWSIYLV